MRPQGGFRGRTSTITSTRTVRNLTTTDGVAGEAKQEAAKAAGRTEGKVEEVVGAVKNRIGQAIDNEQMAAEGKAKELRGEAKQKANE